MSFSCQSATSLLPHFGTLKPMCVTHHFPRVTYISVRSHTICQLAWQNVWSTWTKLFHFIACRLCLLRNVHLPPFLCVSFAPAQVFTPSSWPAPGLSPLYRWRPGCISHANSPACLPGSMLQPLSYFLGSRCCHAHIYQRGSAHVWRSENLILSYIQVIFPI